MKPIKICMALLAAAAATAANGAQTTVEKRSGDDLYAAGASVQVSQPVAGDTVVAGGSVLVTGEVDQDILAAGGSVTITRAVADDIRAAGGTITITDRVGGDAIVGGGTVTLAAGSRVGGNAWAAGGVVHLSGAVDGDVEAAGGEVIVSGRISGDARILADSLVVQPGAVITGTLRHSGPRPASIADEADIGEVIYTERRLERPDISWLGGIFAALVVFISFWVCALLLAWLFPNVCREAADNARDRILASLGAGALTVVVTPILAAALLVLVVTIPAAVALLAAWVVVLIAGVLVAVACLGNWIRGRFMAQRGSGAGVYALATLAAALVYWLLAMVPVAGTVLLLLAFTTGAGGLILTAARMYKQPANP